MTTVFLDLDGTLTDPKLGITRSVAYTLEKLGMEVPALGDLEWMIGPALIDSFARLGTPDPAEALALYRERYTDSGLFENHLYQGIPEVMAQLKRSGHQICLATAKPYVYATRITAHFGLSAWLDHEFGPELDGTRNDKGALLDYALRCTGIDPLRSVMVGDRIHDIRAARAVGMPVIGVAWGYGSAAELSQADAICESPAQLPPMIATLLGAPAA